MTVGAFPPLTAAQSALDFIFGSNWLSSIAPGRLLLELEIY